LTSQDVCNILKECAQTKVSSLRFGGLFVEFGTSEPKANHSRGQVLTNEEHDRQNDVQIQKDAEEARREFISELKLTNPELLEDMVAAGEIKPEELET